jgi:hypothetical protein
LSVDDDADLGAFRKVPNLIDVYLPIVDRGEGN